MKRRISGQNVIEYLVVLAVITAAILSSGVISTVRKGFVSYFNSAVERIR